MTCVANEAEFEQALEQGFGEIYIVTGGGILKHSKLSRGRHVRVKVDSIPGYKEVQLTEELNFLPAGKVPYKLLEEIIQFFRDVMNVKKAEQEAMAHILWNEVEGYHIGIPDQVVSKASVKYDFNHLKPGDIIVVDIHSHNTFGAFFSGTDNGDDKKLIGYSGVVGKLNDPQPMLVWRFNVNEIKRECKMEEIFDVPKSKSATPSQWLEKVKVGSSTYSGNGTGGNWGKGSPVVVYSRMPSTMGKDPRAKPVESITDLFIEEGIPSFMDADPQFLEEVRPKGEGMSPKERNALGLSRFPESDPDPEPKGPGHVLDESEEYAYNAINYGTDVADAVEQIDVYMLDLEGEDKHLRDIVRKAFDLMSAEGQAQLQTNGL
jgi:PRTRC genetic system protein A